MSGGSFDYLYCRDFDGLVERAGHVDAMADALADYPGSEAAVVATRGLLAGLRAMRDRWESPLYRKLADVWHAVEWHHSCDWGRDDVLRVLAEYNAALPHAVAHEAPARHARAALASLPGGADAWPWLRDLVAGAVAAALAEERDRAATDLAPTPMRLP